MKRIIVAASMSIVFLAMGLSCGNSSSPVTPVLPDGAWAGTVLGESITFTVDDGQVKDLQFTFVYWGTDLPADTVIWTPGDAAITSNEFQMTDTLSSGYYSYSLNISGTYNSPSDFSGMLGTAGAFDSLGVHFSTSDSLSWSANRQ